ncbi:MAG: glycosyltransferase family 4 protein [candidate division WOR-3 bacterium]|nr:glycosyltransferase family 4 protein [candidate division WOR-3 bacterium]
MKVLYVVTAFPRFEGDVITPWLVETIRRLQDQDIRVDVFTSAYQGLKQNWVNGINVYRFRYFFRQWEKLTHDETVPDRLRKGILNKLLVVSYLFCGTIGIIRHCRKNKYDVIHCHWPFPHIIFGYAASRFGKSKLISSFYGVELRWVKSKLPIFKPLLKFAIKKSDAVTAISSYTAKEVKEITPADIAIIPFGAAITISDQRVSMIKEKATKDILFVGRLVERKGVRYLIEAFDIITQKTPAKLTIVGTGSEMKNLEELTISKGLQDKIIFAGAIGAPQLEEFYRNCDVFVLPAITDSKGDTEGLGVVLLEAMSYRKPVVASAVGGIIDIVKDGESGFLVPEKKPKLLAQKILKILQEPELAKCLGETGFNFINNYFGWNKIIRDIGELYYKLCG